jgi:hypothetical protein
MGLLAHQKSCRRPWRTHSCVLRRDSSRRRADIDRSVDAARKSACAPGVCKGALRCAPVHSKSTDSLTVAARNQCSGVAKEQLALACGSLVDASKKEVRREA